MGANSFNEMEIDAIGEIMNISLGASATAVSTLLGAKVNITTPVVTVQTKDEFEFKRLEPAVGVEISYTDGLKGKNIMMFRREDVRVIVGMMMGQEIPANEFCLDEMYISAICEVMNQMMGASATAMAEFLGKPVNISIPVSFEITDSQNFKDKYFPAAGGMVIVRFQLEIVDKLKSEFMNIMPVDLAKELLMPFQSTIADAAVPQPQPASAAIDGAAVQPQAAAPQPQAAEPQPQAAAPQPQAAAVQPQPAMAAATGGMPDAMTLQLLTQMQQTQLQLTEMMKQMNPAGRGGRADGESTVIRPLNAQQMADSAGAGVEETANQEMLMTVPLEVSVEIGRTKKLVKDILEFTQGTLVVLDKMAGEQVDLFVNGQCVARGDIVVVEDNFGIRITEIVSDGFKTEETI